MRAPAQKHRSNTVILLGGILVLLVLAGVLYPVWRHFTRGGSPAPAVTACREFVANGRFLVRYPDARGQPVGLRVDVGRAITPELRRRIDAVLAERGGVKWFDETR